MRHLITTLVCAMLVLSLAAQNSGRPNIMVIPFDPDMYFSDSDQMLAKYNQTSVPEVRKLFRYGLTSTMSAKIMSEYGTRSMLQDTTKDVQEDLYAIYKNISYYEDKSSGPQVYAEGEKPAKKSGGFFKRNNSNNDMGTADNVATIDKHEARNYINVKVHSKELLTYISEKYNTDIFLFINQFNLATNYEHCLDRANNVFQREVLVHYSVFDAQGNQLAGDVALVNFPSNSNDIMAIMKANFPALSDNVLASLPNRVRSTSQDEIEHDMNHSIRE